MNEYEIDKNIVEIYHKILQRDPDETGLNYWSKQICLEF